jgi:bifunctional UDP-N-acetylglucosamine pyrophosphorylase/glucosamine-1-phosphate N-acetyltransferase
MVSALPKVLHPLAGIPMLMRVLRTLHAAGFPRPTVLIGYRGDLVREAAGDRCAYIEQGDMLGTGHAARKLVEALPAGVRRMVLVHGDEPLIPPGALNDMLALQARSAAPVVLLTTHVDDTRGFGRVIRDAQGAPIGLPQEGDLTAEQRATVREVNLGAYVFDVAWLRQTLPLLQPHPPKGEFYLTDVVALAADRAVHGEGAPAAAVTLVGGEEVMGVNDLVQLEEATRITYRRTARRHMLAGVRIVNMESTIIGDDVEIEPGVVIYPFSILDGTTRVGAGSQIGPHAHLVDSVVGQRSQVVASTLEEARIGDGVSVGPYAHLRRGADVGDGAEIGNYAEIKGSTIGPGTRMHHMSYLGDAEVGANVNIAAGTITANYDGRSKHRTVIEDGAFVGVDTMLRAPVRIGRGATTGAGSVVLHDVAPGTVVAGVPARSIRESQGDPE